MTRKNHKICPTCHKEWRFRKRVCSCGEQLPTKKELTEGAAVDWTTLAKSNTIYVSNGPYILLKTGKKANIGHRGIFQVIEVKDDGIVAFKDGLCFIYCGNTKWQGSTFYRPHTVRLLT